MSRDPRPSQGKSWLPAEQRRDILLLLAWSIAGVFSQLAFVRMYTTMAGGTGYYGNLILLVCLIALAAGFFAHRLANWAIAIPYGLLLAFLCTLWLYGYNLLPKVSGEFFWTSVANVYARPADFDLQLAIILLSLCATPVMMLLGSQQGRHLLPLRPGFVGYLVMALGGALGGLHDG